MRHAMITTALTLPGYKLTESHGICRGLVVRSRSIVGTAIGGIQSVFGGDISVYTDLCEETRAEAYSIMSDHADQLGANAIISMRYNSTEIMEGLTEVLCYGTAVTAVREGREARATREAQEE